MYSKGRRVCRECRKAYRRARYYIIKTSRNPEEMRRIRGNSYKRLYGITLEEYDAMLEAQGHGCLLCRYVEGAGRKLSVDHCHETKKVRALLCRKCNTAIGLLREDPTLIRRAADYVAANGDIQ